MNKTVVLCAPFLEGSYGVVVHKVLKRMGYKVYPYNYRKIYMEEGQEKLNDKLKSLLKFSQPDYILSIKGEFIDPKIIKDFPGKSVNWWLDHHKRWSYFDKYFDAYDELYLCEEGQGYPWMPIGIDKEINKPTPPNNPIYISDIVFAGTGHPERTKRIQEIVKGNPYDFALWGNSYGRNPFQRGEAIYFEKLMMAYTGSKIILNNHYIKGITPNMRSIEAPSSGTPMLSDTGAGLEKCLNTGTEYIPYDTFKEARYLIRKYMEEPEERAKIGFAGMQRVMKDHTLEQRIEEMLK